MFETETCWTFFGLKTEVGGWGGGMPLLVSPSGYAPVNIYFNKHGIVILLKDFNSNIGVNTHMTSTFRRGVG